jgi:hypothetical protein
MSTARPFDHENQDLRRDPAVNARELRIVGMSRSGNHAIINWILQQADGRTCFLNCCEPKTHPFRSARPAADGKCVEASEPSFDLAAEREGRFSAKDWLLYSYEDCFLGMVNHPLFERYHDEWVGASAHRRDVLILRDPFNLFASRIAHAGMTRETSTHKRIWLQHAREFLGLRHYLPKTRLAVSYNRWTVDRAYRRSIAEALGLRFTDRGYSTVAATAGGSTFDGMRYDGRAAQMKVLERWKRFAGDRLYRSLFDEEMIGLSREIFGDVTEGDERLSA